MTDWRGICPVCKGDGCLFVAFKRQLNWWPCPCCGGACAVFLFGPPTIRSHAK